MSERDAVVAEAVEPKPELPSEEEASFMLMEYISGTRFYSPGRAWETVFIYDHGDVAELLPRTFDSAPTWESDGIVLEWVQKNLLDERGAISAKYRRALGEAVGAVNPPLNVFLAMYKPGMYAKAVLAVLEARDDI